MERRPSLFCLFFFVFYIFSYLLSKSWVAFLGAWCPLPAFRSCFVEFTWHLNALLMNLWGRKCSPRPTPLPSWLLPVNSKLLRAGSLSYVLCPPGHCHHTLMFIWIYLSILLKWASDTVYLGQSLISRFSNKLPGETKAAGPRTIL